MFFKTFEFKIQKRTIYYPLLFFYIKNTRMYLSSVLQTPKLRFENEVRD